MFSKIKIVVVSVVLVTLAFGGLAVALGASMLPSSSAEAAGLSAAGSLPAAAGTPAPTTAAATGTHWAAGQISAIAADNFTIQGPMGGVHVVYVNSQTLYFNHDALASSFASLQVGDRVLGAANIGTDGKATARLVIDMGAKTDYHGIGVASAVNSANQSFTFVAHSGKIWDFYTDTSTKITDHKGNVKTFADIQPGTRLAVHAEKRADGKWWAVEIKLGKTVPPATSNPQS